MLGFLFFQILPLCVQLFHDSYRIISILNPTVSLLALSVVLAIRGRTCQGKYRTNTRKWLFSFYIFSRIGLGKKTLFSRNIRLETYPYSITLKLGRSKSHVNHFRVTNHSRYRFVVTNIGLFSYYLPTRILLESRSAIYSVSHLKYAT